MKRLVLLGLLLLFLISCTVPKVAELKITTSSWSGHSKQFKPEKNDYLLSVKEGEDITFKERPGVSIKVEKIAEDQVKIILSEPLCVREDAGIDFSAAKMNYILTLNEDTLELVTPTTDSGSIYYIDLISIREEK